jgi:hypothetical protein
LLYILKLHKTGRLVVPFNNGLKPNHA